MSRVKDNQLYYDPQKGEAAAYGINLGRGVYVPPDIYKLMTTDPRYKRIKTEEEKEHDRKTRDCYQIN